jgi:hypothetical protein
MATDSSDKTASPAADPVITPGGTATSIQSSAPTAAPPTPPPRSAAAFSIGTVGIVGILLLVAYVVSPEAKLIRGGTLFETLVIPGAVLVGVLAGLMISYVWWLLLAKRADVGLTQDLDFASDLHMVAAKLESTACHLHEKSPPNVIANGPANQVQELAGRVARLARYADTQLARSSGGALSDRRDAQLEQDLTIRQFQERYARLREAKASDSEMQEAIEDFRRQLRLANTNIPAPPLAAIIGPVEAGCYRRKS